MSETKNQKIVIISNLIEEDLNLIKHGLLLAKNFRKEVLVVQHLNRKNKKNSILLERTLSNLLNSIREKNPELSITSLISKINYDEFPQVLADDYEAILILASSLKYKKFATAVSNSPVPFLFINPGLSESSYKNIVFPLDLRKENADTTLWCSWFGRFCNSNIAVVVANDKDTDSKRQVHHNLLFAKKLFQKSAINYKLYKGQRTSLFNSFEASDYAINSKADMLILLGSSTITPLDWLIGLPERKIIKKAGKMPVLLVNPRRDNYILCD